MTCILKLGTGLRQKLSKKYHPDINPDEAAHEKFIEVSKGRLSSLNSYCSHHIPPAKISEVAPSSMSPALTIAYEVLSDSELKGIYDRGGEEGLKQHEARKAGGGGNPHDIFSRFFGGGQGGEREHRGPGLLTNLEVELGDMYAGRTVEVSLYRSSSVKMLIVVSNTAENHLYPLSRVRSAF